ncbi:MAG TPA: hypothetical protein VLK25_12235 [Allosphingosinicella sp.]|nr:hypothetical protein [Allosphingosinicella sp.]
MVNVSKLIDRLTEWAPTIVLADLAFAIAAFWSGIVPAFVIYALSGATVFVALPLAGRRLLSIGFKSREELGFPRNRDAVKFWLFGRGRRDETYGLYLACVSGLILSGWRPPQEYLAFGAAVLAAAWSAATRHWPYEEEKVDPGSSPG